MKKITSKRQVFNPFQSCKLFRKNRLLYATKYILIIISSDGHVSWTCQVEMSGGNVRWTCQVDMSGGNVRLKCQVDM